MVRLLKEEMADRNQIKHLVLATMIVVTNGNKAKVLRLEVEQEGITLVINICLVQVLMT